jgi:hypothetical protein
MQQTARREPKRFRELGDEHHTLLASYNLAARELRRRRTRPSTARARPSSGTRTLAVAGTAGTAARILSSSEALYEETGGGVLSWVAKMNAETLGVIRSQLDDVAFAEAWEEGRALTIDEAVALALDS